MSHQIPSLEELETFGEDSLEKWEVTSGDSFAYDDRLMQQSYTMDEEYYGETEDDDDAPNDPADEYYYVLKKVPRRAAKRSSNARHMEHPQPLTRRAHRQQVIILDRSAPIIPDDSSEPEPGSPQEYYHPHAQTMILPSPSRRVRKVRRKSSSGIPAALNQTVPPPTRRSRSSSRGNTTTRDPKLVPPPPRPIGPIMIRRSSGSRPIIIEAEPMGRKPVVRLASGTGNAGRAGRNAHSKKKPTRYRKLKRTDIRKSRLEGELQRTAQHLEDLKLALKVYNTLDNQEQQKLVDDIVYTPQQPPNKRTIPPARRSTQRWQTAAASLHPSYNIDEVYEEDEDEVDDISDPHFYRQAGMLREQPVLRRRAMGGGHPSYGHPVAGAYNSLTSIFSPRRTQKNLAPPPADTDSESSQVYMYDDDDISQHYQNMIDPDEEETSVTTITTNSNSAMPNDIRSRGSGRRSRGSVSSTTATAGQSLQPNNPHGDLNNMIVRSNIRASAEEASLPDPDDEPDEDEDDEDLDDDEEDEDGLPFTTSTNPQESLLFDQDKIGQETILQEVEYLMQQFKENLGFLFVILRELRNVTTYETRLACLKFFESCRAPQTHQTGQSVGAFLASAQQQSAEYASNTRSTPTLNTTTSKASERKHSLNKYHSNSQSVSERTSDSEISGRSARNETSRSSSTSSSSSTALRQRRPSENEINKIAKQMPDEETSDDEDDEEEEDETSNGSTSNNDDGTDEENEDATDEEDDDNTDEGSDNSANEEDIDSQTAKSKNLLETLNLKLISLVYDRESTKTVYTSKFLTRLSRDVLLTVSRFVPTATVELLESLHDTVMNYSGQNIASCRDDLIQEVLDMLYDETIFNRLMSNIDMSYKEDIAAMKNRLNSLKKQRKEDIEKLKNDRLARLKAGNPYPHTLVQPSGAMSANTVASPTHRFRQGANNQGHVFGVASSVDLFPPQQSVQKSRDSTHQQHMSSTPQRDHTYPEEDEDEFDYGENEPAPTAEQYSYSLSTHERVKEEEPVKRRTPIQRGHHTLESTNSPRKEEVQSSPKSLKRDEQRGASGANSELGFIVGGRKIPIGASTVPSSNPTGVRSPMKANTESTADKTPQHISGSLMSGDSYAFDGFSEISNQATFDLSSDFDYTEFEDPIDLANQVLHREELRRSQMSDYSHSHTTDDLSGFLSIDDLPSSVDHTDAQVPDQPSTTSRESLEKPMLVLPEEETEVLRVNGNDFQQPLTPPRMQRHEGNFTTDISEDVQTFVNLFGDAHDRQGATEGGNIPSPSQHPSFSLSNQMDGDQSPVITREFARSLQILTQKYGATPNRL